MNCGDSQKLIALYMEGDLAAAGLSELENHLASCDSCRAFAEELRESQETFKSLRHERMDESALHRLRHRVMGEVRRMDSLPWHVRLERFLYLGLRRGPALAGLALFLAISGAIWYAVPPSEVPPPQIAQPLPPPTVTFEPVNTAPGPVHAAARPQRRPRAAAPPVLEHPAEERREVLVKLLTDDPNIVIYWLVEQNGGDE
jgi:hypothetical protein